MPYIRARKYLFEKYRLLKVPFFGKVVIYNTYLLIILLIWLLKSAYIRYK